MNIQNLNYVLNFFGNYKIVIYDREILFILMIFCVRVLLGTAWEVRYISHCIR